MKLNNKTTQILTGARIFDGHKFLNQHVLIVEDGKVSHILEVSTYENTNEDYRNAETIQFSGGILTAGFVDLQVNGGGGILLNETPTIDGLKAIIAAHRKFGTTSMLPTFISDTIDNMKNIIEVANRALAENVSGMVGLHLEGPYFNFDRRGVHLPSMIRPVDDGVAELYKSLKNGVLMVTLAPEKVPNGFISDLVKANILVYAGHSDATYEQIKFALAEGLNGFTHLYNAMSPLTNREPGVVGAALDDEYTYVGLILDGKHVSSVSAKVAISAKKQGKICLVTDAMPPVGTDDDSFQLYGEKINVRDGTCITDGGTLAGSALDMATAVRNCHQDLGISLEESLKMASLYPAAALGMDHKIGQLKTGFQADIIHLNDELYVTKTSVNGNWT